MDPSSGADLDIVDVTGRLRACVPARWGGGSFDGDPALAPGTYVVRFGSLGRRVTLRP